MAKVMIVDDAAFMRMVIKSILTKNGHEVVAEALDGEDSVKKYKEFAGIKSAVEMDQNLVDLGMTQKIVIESVSYNEKIEDGVFEIPESVKPLLKEKTE